MAELSPILAELEKLYSKLGGWKGLTPGEAPIIALSSKGRKRTQTGWYNPAKWVDTANDTLDALAGVPVNERVLVARAEIVIATELLSDPVSTAAELYRQAVVHTWANADAITSVVGKQGYYPIYWETVAQAHEFMAYILPDQPSRGWGGWEPLDRAKWAKWVADNMDLSVFEVSRNSDAPLKPTGSRMKKWQCDCTVIRSATKVQATCFGCGKQFWWAEKDPPPQSDYNLHTDQRDMGLPVTPENLAAGIGGQVIKPRYTLTNTPPQAASYAQGGNQ
jgi:hypothetical protein